MTQNQLRYWELREKNRNNTVTERETGRHNRKTEQLQDKQITTTYNLGLMNLAETNRANLAREAENTRSNQAREALTKEQNLIGWRNADISQQNADTNRMNAVTNQGMLAETITAHRNQEAIQMETLDETKKHNRNQEATNSLNALNAVAKTQNEFRIGTAELQREYSELAEKVRHNMATEEETKRYNDIRAELERQGLLIENQKVQQQGAKYAIDVIKMGALSAAP